MKLALIILLFVPLIVVAQDQNTGQNEHTPIINEKVVVSATKTPEESVEVPGSTSVITREEIKRTGAKTVAEAIENIVGIDTGNGSDEGPRLANIGMWGLKEFDALLITVDGVPAGGPFNPSLSQINIDDIDRIEIVKGPQGTLYGVSAFAGMIQVFTRKTEQEGGTVGAGAGSFSNVYGNASYTHPFSENDRMRFYGSVSTADGWQDRTGLDEDRFKVDFEHEFKSAAKFQASFFGYRYDQDWGSPLPFDAGQIVPGFEIDRNYAFQDAAIEHHLFGISSNYSRSLTSRVNFENIFGFTHDNQHYLRSFIQAIDGEDGNIQAESEGILLDPTENTLFEEARLITNFDAGGPHHLVTGGAITWGRTEASGHGFDFELDVAPVVEVPGFEEVPTFGDNRAFEDRRTFLGFYARDEWNLHPRVELAGGVRLDHTSEDLEAEFEELGGGEGEGEEGISTDSRSDTKVSGDGSILYRLIEGDSAEKDRINLYFAAKTTFKPAAPNLTEAESAEILKPERAKSIEGGVKTRAFHEQFWFDASLFRMNFKNLVVSTVGQNGEPVLVNAGEERFTGIEFDMEWHPVEYPNLYLRAGYAHHSPKFVSFTFLTPEGELRDVSGNFLELVPRNLFNTRAVYAPEGGVGGFVAVRFQGERFLNRRNTFLTDSFTEWDAGVNYTFSQLRIQLTGRNLGDSRHPIAESEIGDSQFYIAPPRRFSVDATWSF